VPDDDEKPDQPKPPPSPSPPEAAEGSAAPHDEASSAASPDPGESLEDRFRPDAIAARIERIGDETDIDRIAHQEEQKLLERRKQQKKAKRGLEAAASKRLARIGEGTVKRPSAASDAYVPEADPLLERVHRARKWIEAHRQTFGGLVAVAVIGVSGILGWTYWQNKHEAEGSALLAQAFADEHGHVSDKEDDDDDSSRARQLYPTFKSAADRRNAALAKYREVESKYPGTGAAILAHLAEAGLLLDQGDAKGAIAAYEDVKTSPLAQADAEVRGRALEGVGFGRELLAQDDVANKDKHLDDALAAFKALENVDMKGFKELGMYHQARVLQEKGDRPKAVEILKEVYKRVTEPGESRPFSYLEFVVEDRLRDLDPAALPPKAAKMPGGLGPGGVDMQDPQVQQLIRQLQQQAQQKGGGPIPVMPKGP
jgi:hypothetical protein